MSVIWNLNFENVKLSVMLGSNVPIIGGTKMVLNGEMLGNVVAFRFI